MFQQQFNPYGFQPFQQSFQQFPEVIAVVVPTVNDVEQTRVLPGETKFVLVQNAPVLAIRMADKTGLNITTEYRHTEVFDPKAMQQKAEEAQVNIIQQLQQEMQEIKKQLGGLTNASVVRGTESAAK